MDKYLLNVNGQGDTNFCVVDKNVWDWVHNNDTTFPDFLKDEFRKNYGNHYSSKHDIENEILDVEESINGDENDKALTVMCCFNYAWSVMDLNKYCRKHNINIVGEYTGLIY